MQSSSTLPLNRRIPTLDGAAPGASTSSSTTPTARRYGIPTYPYRWAPKYLLHRPPAPRPRPAPRRPAPIAQILWRPRHCASPTSTAPTSPCPNGRPPPPSSPPSAKALAARRTCPTCGTEKPYCIPRSTGECNDCTARR